jgi:prepilin peptidase CpaA
MTISDWVDLARHCVLFAVLIAAAYTDLAQGKIYNWLVLPGIALGLVLNLAVGGLARGGPWGANLLSSGLGIGMVLLVFIWPYLKGGIAAGDVKLMVAVGAIGGMHRLFTAYALFFASLVGALMALLVLIWRGRLRQGLRGAARFAVSLRRVDGQPQGEEAENPEALTVPYGFAIAVGSIIAWYMVEVG